MDVLEQLHNELERYLLLPQRCHCPLDVLAVVAGAHAAKVAVAVSVAVVDRAVVVVVPELNYQLKNLLTNHVTVRGFDFIYSKGELPFMGHILHYKIG